MQQIDWVIFIEINCKIILKINLIIFFMIFFGIEFSEMVEYMRVRGEDTKQIDKIQQTFDTLLSM